jgi:N-acetylglucosamine malate deacetylase 2
MGHQLMIAHRLVAVRVAALLLCACSLRVMAWSEEAPKILLVVAHPDDEYYFAATTYKLAVERNAQVDEVVITDGEGGYRYSTLAEPYYGKSLTVESIGRKDLPAIRRQEAINAGRVLGIRRHYFFNQKDERFTTDAQAGTKSGWDTTLITARIADLIRKEHYEYIFCILPRVTTHGHHQAAAALAAVAVHGLPENLHPVILGFDTDASRFTPASGGERYSQWDSGYAFAFDRTARFGFHDALSYQIVVDWMIAEHKSQGLLQTMCEKESTEYAWVDRASAPAAEEEAAHLFSRLQQSVAHR